LSHLVSSAVIVAVEPVLPLVVRGGANAIFPLTAHATGAMKVTRFALVVEAGLPPAQAAIPRIIKSPLATAPT
jgi:hypothetical protein